MSRESVEKPLRFVGATVVITGASSGLGAHLAESFTHAGANVVLFARSKERLDEVAVRCRNSQGEAVVVAGDVTNPADCKRLVDETVGRYGSLDILIACAGLGMWAPFAELEDPAVMRRVMDVNYGGVVNPFYYALPEIKKSRGILVAVSSIQGKIGVPYHTGYSASKHAVQGFCDSLRMELRGSKVTILTVIAHWIKGTNLREHALGPDGKARGGQAHPHGSGAVPVGEMAEAILEAVKNRKRVIFVPGWLRFLFWLSAIAPAAADALVARRVGREASFKANEDADS